MNIYIETRKQKLNCCKRDGERWTLYHGGSSSEKTCTIDVDIFTLFDDGPIVPQYPSENCCNEQDVHLSYVITPSTYLSKYECDNATSILEMVKRIWQHHPLWWPALPMVNCFRFWSHIFTYVFPILKQFFHASEINSLWIWNGYVVMIPCQ